VTKEGALLQGTCILVYRNWEFWYTKCKFKRLFREWHAGMETFKIMHFWLAAHGQ